MLTCDFICDFCTYLFVCLSVHPSVYPSVPGCLDTLTTAQQLGLSVFEEEKEKHTTSKVYSKEDYSIVNRFESKSGFDVMIITASSGVSSSILNSFDPCCILTLGLPVLSVAAGHGGGWGYSGHSIEAVRFMADTDIMLGGFGLFGGRGEYFGKIKVLLELSNRNVYYVRQWIMVFETWTF